MSSVYAEFNNLTILTIKQKVGRISPLYNFAILMHDDKILRNEIGFN